MSISESVEQAQKTTGIVTAKDLLAVVKLGSDGLGMHGEADPARESYSNAFVFTVNATKKDRKTKFETKAQIAVPGRVGNGHTSERTTTEYKGSRYPKYTGTYSPRAGFWYLTTCASALIDVLELLPSAAEVSFFVHLDAGTTDYLIAADSTLSMETHKGLHADHLYLDASYMVRGKRVSRRFLIDTSVGAHNSARFGCPSNL